VAGGGRRGLEQEGGGEGDAGEGDDEGGERCAPRPPQARPRSCLRRLWLARYR